MLRIVLGLVTALLMSQSGALAEPDEGSVGYIEAIEAPGEAGGMADEVDAGVAQAAASAGGGSVPGVSRRQAGRVEEIVVQARKRAELLEDTPISVSALAENTLREFGVQRLDQIGDLVPNLNFRDAPTGQAAIPNIRGVGTPRVLLQFDPGVGIYVDGVYLPRALGSLIDVLDVQQIEVLRGPQGTLFGKNTVGGAINITTRKPAEEVEGFVFVRPANFGSVDARAMLNLPVGDGWLEDRLFTRLAVATSTTSGYTYNEYRDENWSNDGSLTFLGSVRFLPWDNLSIDWSGSWSQARGRPLGGECVFVRPTGLQALSPDLVPACEKTSPYRFSANVAGLTDVKSYGTWGTVAWDVGELGFVQDLVVKSITSWREQVPRNRVDVDQTFVPVVQLSNVGGGQPLDGDPGYQEQVSQELQVNGSSLDGRLNFVGGFFGFWEEGTETGGSEVLPNVPLAASARQTSIDNWNWAFYSQATLDLLQWMSLTAGVRYTEEKKGLSTTLYNLRTEQVDLDESADEIFSAWTPMASLALTAPTDLLGDLPIEHLMAYFSYSRGFRGGGFNSLTDPIQGGLVPFAPEFLNSFEVGTKVIALDQRLTFNFAGFMGDYTDLQVTSVRDVGDLDGDGVPEVLQETRNAADAITSGIEIEMLALPVEGLRATGSVGLLFTRYEEFIGVSDFDGSLIDRKDETLNNAPRLQTHISLQYSFPIDWEGPAWLQGWLTPRLDWSYQSEVHYNGPELAATNQRGFNLLHARLSYDFADDRTQIALWGQNLTDEAYFTFGSGLASTFGIAARFYAPPRTWGAEISHRF